MSAGIKNVSVIRSEYTPRDSYLNGLTGKISLTLKTLSYIHIGSGAFKLYVDINVVKRFIEYFKRRGFDYALSSMSDKITKAISYDFSAFTRYGDKITIPGSTIKGLLRSRLELLFKGTSGSTNACFSKAGIPLSVVPNKGLHGWRHVRIWGNVVFENRGPPCNLTSLGTNVCKVCDIFGAPGLASRVFVGNFYPVNNNVTERKELEYGEKLEVVKPGVTFKGDITFHSLTLDELGLIFIGLGAKKDGTFVPILIGKHKYSHKDFGKAIFNVVDILIYEYNIPKDIEIEKYEGGLVKIKNVKDFITRAVEEACNKYPAIADSVGFSEAIERDKKIFRPS